MVAGTHRVEVEVDADGHASALRSGAAAATPPAGAAVTIMSLCNVSFVKPLMFLFGVS
jgi:hypothetical protein